MYFDDREIQQLYSLGLPDKEIAERSGHHYKSVARWRRLRGLKSNVKQGRPRLAKKAIIDEKEVSRLYDLGLSDECIAEHFEVSYKTISRWRKRNNLEATLGKNKRKEVTLSEDVEKKARLFIRSLVWGNKVAKERGNKLNINLFIDYWRDEGEHTIRKVMGL